jgi:hypothetical protein
VCLPAYILFQGVPFDPEDAIFNPPIQRPSRTIDDSYEIIPSPRPEEYIPGMVSNVYLMSFSAVTIGILQTKIFSNHKNPPHNRVIPLEEDIRRLFQECEVGRGNASFLSEALMFAKPEDLKEREIVKASHHLTLLVYAPTMILRNFMSDVGLRKNSFLLKFLGPQLVLNDHVIIRLIQLNNIVRTLRLPCHWPLISTQKIHRKQLQRSFY